MEQEDASVGHPSELGMADPSGKNKKGKKKMVDQKKSQSLEEPLAGSPRNGAHPSLSRSKTYDPSFSKEAEKETGSSQHRNSISNLMKHSVNFHRAFKDLPEEEELLETFSCAWQREMPYHGRLYVSHNHVCFYCSMLRREVKVIIPVATVSILKKANTALLVPNAISIRTTEGEKFLFGSLRSRETTYQLLRSVCKHLQDGSRNPSPTASNSSPEHLLKISLTSRQLDNNPAEDEMLPDESGLYTTYQQHCPSNNPDWTLGLRSMRASPGECVEEATISPKCDRTFVEWSGGIDLLRSPAQSGDGMSEQEKPLKTPAEQLLAATNRGSGPSKKPLKTSWSQVRPLNVIILIYLVLVVVLLLSSGYIGLRIVQLEEQLTSMGAWPELDLQQPYKAS